jgi:hypothetical protein
MTWLDSTACAADPTDPGAHAAGHATAPSPPCTAWRCACPVCYTEEAAEQAYFSTAFSGVGHAEATGEGIADALGYCSLHGAMLMAAPAPQATVLAAVLRAATARVLPLLEAQRFGDDKFQQVYFGAAHNCPACTHVHRATGRHSARLARRHVVLAESTAGGAAGTGAPPDAMADTRQLAGEQAPEDALCITHFPSFAHALKPEWRMPALARYARVLGDCPPEDVPGLAIGSAALPSPRTGASPTGTVGVRPDIEDSIAQALSLTEVCVVCQEIEHARQRWLASVPIAAAQRLDAWLFFPTCREHLGTVAALGDAALSGAVARYALDVAAEQLHQQWRTLALAAQTETEVAAARITRWGRRPRRKKSEPPRPPPPKAVRCAACERLAISELRATFTLLRLLRAPQPMRTFEAGFGLCMKHHAQACLLAPKGRVRLALAADQRRRLLDRSSPRSTLRRFCGCGGTVSA